MYGKPIVTTAGGGIPAVVERGGNALLAEPGDAASLTRALRAVVGSEELRRRLGARSRALYLERSQIAVVAEAMSELLAEAVRAHAAHPPEPSVAGWLAAAVPQDDTAAELRLRTLEASRSWRLTAPLRSAARAVRERVRP
jgi:hypothetical protein